MIEVKEAERVFKPGDIVQHFKRELLEGEKDTSYLYMIVDIAYHTETHERLVIYKALYDDRCTYARPYDMFMSKVDRVKYPNIKQTYRFELYEG